MHASRIPEHIEDRVITAAQLAANVPNTEAEKAKDISLKEALQSGPPLDVFITNSIDLKKIITLLYKNDPLFGQVLKNPDRYRGFMHQDGLIHLTNPTGQQTLCIPKGIYRGRSI
jgi:hypothetical protein